MSLNKPFFILLIGLSSATPSFGRTDHLSESYSPHATRPIARAYILYAKKVWRDIYLNEKKNGPCFMRGKEISKVIVDGVKNGLLVPYTDDTLTEIMPQPQFLKNLQIPGEDPSSSTLIHEFFPKEISILRLAEHVIFNKVTARQEYDIESIQLIVPGRNNPPTYLDHTIATFKYKDLIDYFNKLPFESICWYNTANAAESLTWIDAFALRLFGSRIIKVGNVDDATVDELYEKKPGDPGGLMASQRLAIEIDVDIEGDFSEH
ncbi:MAG: gliding motility protein GldN [Candidatus Cardinium sp.]|uniref:type IX secretion system ring protein PorN/GldN n=1 Tax=Cardinium endosymbiont of Dermatophagoides farinae TaxID=2597823 RepID=UPI001182FA20|nr:gliding motility protein GldN [Cardinium endosymbiont of Dermatophagoides farinae]TSJ81461.1 gliding motility protein GldN [Cardinium endosymbiont of Dermatophagoides farinae]UWW96439.1 MAG: gliding motility protein GldN [Candidatus Cardinium sp.]